MNNQLHNCTNPYQGNAKRVLCVCSAGLLRSPTAANVLHQEYGYNTRSAGCEDSYAMIPVNDALLYWANEVVVMTEQHKTMLLAKWPECEEKVVVLGIPDEFAWNDKALRALIKARYDQRLESYEDTNAASP